MNKVDYKKETEDRESFYKSAIKTPRSKTFTIDVKASDFDSYFIQDSSTAHAPNRLIEIAIAANLTKDVAFPSGNHAGDWFRSTIACFNGFVVIKNRIYKMRPYTDKAFAYDAFMAKKCNYSDAVLRTITFSACELITYDEPENNN